MKVRRKESVRVINTGFGESTTTRSSVGVNDVIIENAIVPVSHTEDHLRYDQNHLKFKFGLCFMRCIIGKR